ncbi:hypothetical protein ACROYT_G027006 [Oculina patagonica]
MAHGNYNFYRSKSLNAQWEDLSRSVSYVLNEHEGPEPKAEALRQISTSHWVESLERTHCAEGNCRKKFTLTERKHHCRRCGEVFCGKCSQYRRRLSLFATPDPNGISYRVCKRCFDVGPQKFGAARSLMREFHIWREQKKREKNNNHTDGPVQPVNDFKENNDVKEELQRLVEGYTKHIGKSKIKSFVTEAFSFVKIPEWQKSKHWMPSSSRSDCTLCSKKFKVTETKSNCKVCGAIICSSCSSETLILYPAKESGTVQWTLINIIGSPDEEPAGCLYVRVCNACHSKAAELQGNTVTDGPAVGSILDDIADIHTTLRRLQVKISDLLPKYETLVDAVEAKGDLKGLVPAESSATQTLAKYHVDLSDLFTQFAIDMQGIRRLKPQTNTQIKLAKNLTSSMFNFYGDNFPVFRECKKRVFEILPQEVLEKVQVIVDQNAINNSYIYIKQLGLEALLLADKHKFDNQIAVFLADCENVCLNDLRTQIEACHEDWDRHQEVLREILQINVKKHRLILPSRRWTLAHGANYVQCFLFDRSSLLVAKTLRQLNAKTTEKKFSASKQALQKLSEQLSGLQ